MKANEEEGIQILQRAIGSPRSGNTRSPSSTAFDPHDQSSIEHV